MVRTSRPSRESGTISGGNRPRFLPGRSARRDRRAFRLWYVEAGLPLYGLPAEWNGYRCPGQRAGRQGIRRAGPFGILTRASGPPQVAALGLSHIGADGERLHVASHRVSNYRTLEAMAANTFFRRLALPLLHEGEREAFETAVTTRRKQFRSGQLGWEQAVIPVDADAVPFRVLTVGTAWVALAEVGGIYLQIDAERFPLGRVRLVCIHDPEPYLARR